MAQLISVQNSKEEINATLPKPCGLQKSYHGIVYQLQWIMTVALNARKHGGNGGFIFRTELNEEDVGKFDDVVWQYQDGISKKYNFLQCKHKLNNGETITLKELLKTSDQDSNPFSLQKYFKSYRDNIKPNPKYQDGQIENLIIATNINLSANIRKYFKTAEYVNPVLSGIRNVWGMNENPQCLKINSDYVQKELVGRLEETYDLVKLARKLGQSIREQTKFELPPDLIQYQNILLEHILDKSQEKLSDNFIENSNLSIQVKFFREAFFQEAYIKEKNHFKLPDSLTIHYPTEFAEMFATAIVKSKNKIVKINRSNFKKLRNNIDMLAGFVLIKEDTIKFNDKFWSISEHELPNESFEIFRDALQKYLQISCIISMFDKINTIAKKLNEYSFQITNFVTCRKELINESSFWENVKNYTGFHNHDQITRNIEQKQSLPIYSVDDIKKEIVDFFNSLIFALGYSRQCLSQGVQYELDTDFSCIDNEYVAEVFRSEIGKCLDPFEVKFISTAEEVVNFLNVARQQVNRFILIGPTLEYQARLNKNNIKFSRKSTKKLKLRSFLTLTTKTQVFIVTTRHSKLSAMKVYQILETIPQYAHNKQRTNYIYMELSTAIHLMNVVVPNFKYSYNLLIIECNTATTGNEHFLFIELSRILNLHNNKKLILIAKENNCFGIIFKTYFGKNFTRKFDKRINFLNLTKVSQNVLLNEAQINFQGNVMKLGLLFNKGIIDLLTSDALFTVINQGVIKIGSSLKKINDYYINRTFCRKVALEKTVFQENDIFIISNTNKLDTNKDNNATANVKTLSYSENHLHKVAKNKNVIINDQLTTEEFNLIGINKPNYNIHWLNRENDYFLWRQTKNNLSLLHKHLRDDNVIEYKEHNEFFNTTKNKKVTIVSAEPGMGKSTVITSIALAMKSDPQMWILRINLLHYSSDFKRVVDENFAAEFLYKIAKFKVFENKKNLTNFISTEIRPSIMNNKLTLPCQKLNLTSCEFLELGIFNYFFNNGRVKLLFDGYDEICSSYEQEATKLLKILSCTKVSNIFITTRPYNILYNLENTFSEFSYYLKPFNCEDQTAFITKYWASNLGLHKLNKPRAKLFIDQLLKTFSQTTSDKDRKFLSIPLQLYMVACIFQNTFKDYYECNFSIEHDYKIKIEQKLNLVTLYEEFLDIKFKEIRFKEKKPGTNYDFNDTKHIMKRERKKFEDDHQKMALYVLFKNDIVSWLSPAEISETIELMELIKAGDEENGIVSGVINDLPIFVHQTFAEYFAANYIWKKFMWIENIKYEPFKNLILNQLFSGEYLQTCKFFYFIAEKYLKENVIFCQKDNKIESLLKSIIDPIINIHREYQTRGFYEENGTDNLNNSNNSLFRKNHDCYIPCIKLLFRIIESYLFGIKFENEAIITIINENYTIYLLSMCAELGCIKFVTYFLNLNSTFNYKGDLSRKKWYYTPFWFAAKNHHLEVLNLLKDIYDCNWEDKDRMNLCQRIFSKNEKNVLRSCLKLNLLEVTPYTGINKGLKLPLLTALFNRNPSDIIKMLIKKTDVNIINEFNEYNLSAPYEMSTELLAYEKEITEMAIAKGVDFFGVINLLLYEFRHSSLEDPIYSVGSVSRLKCSYYSEAEFLNVTNIIDVFLVHGIGFNVTDCHDTTTIQYAEQIYYIHELLSYTHNVGRPLQTVLKLLIDHVLTKAPGESNVQIEIIHPMLLLTFGPNESLCLIPDYLQNLIKLSSASYLLISSTLYKLQLYINSAKDEIIFFKTYKDSKVYGDIFTGYKEMLKYEFGDEYTNKYKRLGWFEKRLLHRLLMLYIWQNYDIQGAFKRLASDMLKSKALSTWMKKNKHIENLTLNAELIELLDVENISTSENQHNVTSKIYDCGGFNTLGRIWVQLNEISPKQIPEVMKSMTKYLKTSKHIFKLLTQLNKSYNKLTSAIKCRSYSEILNILQAEEPYDKAIINGQDKEYGSPLHYAVYTGDPELTKILLSLGANPNYRLRRHGRLLSYSKKTTSNDNENYEGHTSLHLAIIGADAAIVQMLQSYKADCKIKNVNGLNALQLAANESHINPLAYQKIIKIFRAGLINSKKTPGCGLNLHPLLPLPSHQKKRRATTEESPSKLAKY